MKMKYLWLILVSLGINAQTIFEFGEQQVSLDEFKYVYEKNNNKDSNIYSRSSVEEYLNLYVNFKLKVEEAKEMKLNDTRAFAKELAGYRKQLAQSYLKDTRVTKKLLQEAYDRSQKDVHVSHILIKVAENATPKDRKAALKRINELRDELRKGADFNELASKHSQDPSARENNGDIGFVSVFRTVYDFETAAFNTPIGEVSEPVETKFGYHLVNVIAERPARGEVRVAHMFLKKPKFAEEEKQKAIKERIYTFHSELQNGADWNAMIVENSEDKSTKKNAGDLQWFGTGKMVPVFEDAAFGLKNKGEISEPIETEYGWHILKLLDKRPLGTFDEMKSHLKAKVEKDSRSEVAKSTFIGNLKKEFNYKEYPIHITTFIDQVDESYANGQWKGDKIPSVNTPLLTIRGRDVMVGDFIPYLEKHQRRYRSQSQTLNVRRNLDRFIEAELFKEEDSLLEEKHPDFVNLMREYHDGMLLFELTNTKVWEKAVTDSTGLDEFYKRNRRDYVWDPRANTTKLKCDSEKTAEKAIKFLDKGFSNTKVAAKLNKKSPEALRIQKGKYEKGENEYLDSMDWEVGERKVFADPDGGFQLLIIDDIVIGEPKALEDAKGYVISDYQAELEAEWISELRKKYPVSINKRVVEGIIKN